MANLIGKVALITGGSRGIGAAIARRLAKDGANVAFTYVSQPDKAAAVAKDIAASGREAIAIQADAASPIAIREAVSQVMHQFGRLDILVNNAGILEAAPLPDLALEALDRLININIRGVFTACQEAAKVMEKGSRIVNIGSVSGVRAGMVGMTGYAMTKSALIGLTKGMAWDLGKLGITVNVIQPGPIETDMNPRDTPWADQLVGMLAVPRYGQPDEIAAGVAYLVSPEAAFVTGSALTIDGGFLS